jgi:phosphoserine aminotransferase
MDDPDLEREFLAACKANGMVGHQGSPQRGRDSGYPLQCHPLESVEVLTELMNDFAHTKA